MTTDDRRPISAEELAAESAAGLPDKEVVSLLDLNADLNLALDAAAPIDLGVAANANAAAPIEASIGANVLSAGSTAVASADQTGTIGQDITGDAVAHAPQVSSIDQSGGTGGADPAPTEPATSTTADPNGALDGPLLNVNVNLDGDLNLAAPIDGAVAAQANVAAPIDASAAANVGSVDSVASAVSHQDMAIDQSIDGNASATADQQSSINQ